MDAPTGDAPEEKAIVERQDLPIAPTDGDVSGEKNRALLPVLRAFAEEVEKRIDSGSLATELGEMRTTQILFHLGKLAQALKGPSVQIANVINPPNPNKLRAYSARNLTPEERDRLHRRMDRKRD